MPGLIIHTNDVEDYDMVRREIVMDPIDVNVTLTPEDYEAAALIEASEANAAKQLPIGVKIGLGVALALILYKAFK